MTRHQVWKVDNFDDFNFLKTFEIFDFRNFQKIEVFFLMRKMSVAKSCLQDAVIKTKISHCGHFKSKYAAYYHKLG